MQRHLVRRFKIISGSRGEAEASAYPENIRFLDDPFLNYVFPDKEEKE